MHKDMFIILVLMVILVAVALTRVVSFASPTSASYVIAAQVVDMGGGTSESANYSMLGKARDYLPSTPTTGISYTIGEGFLRSVFYKPILHPFILAIHPSSGNNDRSVYVTISGGNFRQIGVTTVELRLTGEPTITATGVTVVSAETITCRMDLRGAKPGFYTVFVGNDGSDVTLASAFEIKEAELKIIGTPLNFPNPFAPGKGDTVIKYMLTRDADIVINLYSIQGDKIWSKKFPAGEEGGRVGSNAVSWDGKNLFDATVANGVYICQISTSRGKTLGIIKIAVLR